MGTKRINGGFYHFRENDVRWLHGKLNFTQNGEGICHEGQAKGSLMGVYKAECR